MVRQPVLPPDRIDPPPSPAVDRGFTLIEITISIVILTVLALTTAMIVVPISRQQRTARESELANAAVRGVLESIQATPFFVLLDRYPSELALEVPELPNGEISLSYFMNDNPDYFMNDDPAEDSVNLVPLPEEDSPDLIYINIHLSWTSPDWGEVERTFFTVRTE